MKNIPNLDNHMTDYANEIEFVAIS